MRSTCALAGGERFSLLWSAAVSAKAIGKAATTNIGDAQQTVLPPCLSPLCRLVSDCQTLLGLSRLHRVTDFICKMATAVFRRDAGGIKKSPPGLAGGRFDT